MATWTKKVWETGEIITAEGLNNAEDGIEVNSDKINDLRNHVYDEIKPRFVPYTISTTTSPGKIYSQSSNRAGTANLIPGDSIIEFDESVKISLRYYNSLGILQSSSGWLTTSPYNVDYADGYIRVNAAYANDRNITDLETFGTLLKIRAYGEESYAVIGTLGTTTGVDWEYSYTSNSAARATFTLPHAVKKRTRFEFDKDYLASLRFISGDLIVATTDFMDNYVDIDKMTSDSYDSIMAVFKKRDESEITEYDLEKIKNGYVIQTRQEDRQSFSFSQTGSYLNPSATTYNNTGKIPCSPGDVFRFRARVKGAAAIVAYDGDNNVVDMLYNTHDTNTVDGGFIARESWKYVYCNAMNSTHADYEAYTPLFEKVPSVEAIAHNFTIKCAKEKTYNDGTPPTIEWYLLADVRTNMFYKSYDLKHTEYIFTFDGNAINYSFGITDNGDIIAVFKTESLEDLTTHSDTYRKNPYVWLHDEGYRFAHALDFGSSLKPSGWLENAGFRVTPNGTVLFCEYTRPSVATANVWRIERDADPTDPANWDVVKSFSLSGNTQTGFKHCHMIMCDPYTGVTYLATGDDDDGAYLFHSVDDGETWTQTRQPSEKYCRMLNLIFTEDYIYWASDTFTNNMHYVFKAVRDNQGVLSYTGLLETPIPYLASEVATYGTAYIKEMGMLLLCERVDGPGTTEMPVRAYDMTTDTLITLGYIHSATGAGQKIGFRTEYTEWYPKDGSVKFGFGGRMRWNSATNLNRVGGNRGTDLIEANVNVVLLKPFVVGSAYGFVLDKIYIE